MATLPTDRTIANTREEHVDDHNELHDGHNLNEAHRADSTGVHGIADTALLETQAGAAAKVATHETDTTNVHGIPDTTALVVDGDAAGGVLSGTYPNPGFAADMASQAELDAHINDVADAHDASAISIADAANDFTATDVEGALAELKAADETDEAALADHLADAAGAHAASAISILDAAGDFTATDVEGALAELQSDHEADEAALANHLADGVGAHAASAVSFTPSGLIIATDVQAALQELDTEKVAKADFKIVRRTTDSGSITSSTVLTDDTQLLWPVLANEVWFFEAFLLVSAVNATMDIKFGLNLPAGAAARWGSAAGTGTIPGWGSVGAGSSVAQLSNESNSPSVAVATRIAPENGVSLAGIVMVGATAGDVKIQWAQNTSDAAALKLLANSFLRLHKMA